MNNNGAIITDLWKATEPTFAWDHCGFTGNHGLPLTPAIYQIETGLGEFYHGRAEQVWIRYLCYLRRFKQMRDGKPYSKSSEDGFRAVHHMINRARKSGHHSTMRIVEVVTYDTQVERERHWFQFSTPGLNGRAA